MLTKKEIRKEILAMRKALDEETVALASQVICRKVLDIEAYQEAENLCLYMPYNNEVDVMLLAEIAEEDGKNVWVPKVVSRDGEMVFNRYEGEEATAKGEFNITESTSEEILKPDDKTVIIMPGAVFTPWRDRIGYGGGFYDRFLQEHPECRTIAVCYDIQVVDELPAEEHDIRPDYLVCESGIYR